MTGARGSGVGGRPPRPPIPDPRSPIPSSSSCMNPSADCGGVSRPSSQACTATGTSCRWASAIAASRCWSRACTPPFPIKPMRWSVAPRCFTPRHSSTSGGSWKNSPDSMACEMRTMSCGTTRPAPRFRWPTSLLPICPAGSPTAKPDALRSVRDAFAQRRCQVGVTPRAGFDLVVIRAPEENLRSAPAGALVGRLPQGFLLSKLKEGGTDRWVHVTRTGWVQRGDVEAVAPVATSGAAGASDTAPARLTPGRSPGDEGPPGQRPGVSRGDTGATAPDPSRVEPARRTVLYRTPEGPPSGTLAPAAPLEVLGRSGDWTRVEIDS